MTKFAQPAQLGTEFDVFLHAAVGEEQNGTTLTVLSALARLDIDPWRHAAYLRQLPADNAIRELTCLIEALPPKFVVQPVADAAARRLVALLAVTGIPNRPRGSAPPDARETNARRSRIIRILVGYLFVVLLSEWLTVGMGVPVSTPGTSSAARGASVSQPR